jgi:hypothetical protein
MVSPVPVWFIEVRNDESAGGGDMGETAIRKIDPHVVDLSARCEEHEVAGGEIASADRFAGVRLFAGRPRQLDSELVTKERDDKAGAIRPGWQVTTQTMRRRPPGIHR